MQHVRMKSHLETWRNKKGLTVEVAASQLGVERTTLWRWETGKTKIPAEKIADVSKLTGISRRRLRPDVFGEVSA